MNTKIPQSDAKITPEEAGAKHPKKKWRKRLLTALFVLINVGIIAWTAFSEFGGDKEATKFTDIKLKWWLLIPAVLMFVIALLAETYKYVIMLRRTHSMPKDTNNRKFWKVARRTLLLGRYYDNITPASVGGQPFQIFYLHKNKVGKGFNVVIPIVEMITDQLGFLILGLLALILGGLTGAIQNTGILTLGFIGMTIFAFFPIVILGATFLPKATEEIVTIAVKFLHKIHVVKDYNASITKVLEHVKMYTDGVKAILKEKGLFLKATLLGAAYFAGLLMIPYFVLAAFGSNINIFACFATTVAVSSAVYFIPTPGNAGAAEGAFFAVFSVLPESGYVFWAMLCWRFLIYYIWLILGLITQARIYFEDKNLFKNFHTEVDKVSDGVSEGGKEYMKLSKSHKNSSAKAGSDANKKMSAASGEKVSSGARTDKNSVVEASAKTEEKP